MGIMGERRLGKKGKNGMAFVRALDAEDSKAIHEALRDPTVKQVKFIDTGERAFDHTQAECLREDGTSYHLTRRHKRFRDAFEIVNEMDLPWEFHDDFWVELVMPREFTVECEVEITAYTTLTAYDEKEARELAENSDHGAYTYQWDTADWRLTSVQEQAPAGTHT